MSRHHSTGRRFLNFPAINPCLAATTAALLSDLSSIAATIAASEDCETKTFRTNRRVARRSIAVVIVFLDDLRQASTAAFSRSAILCLSELHVTLQKLRLLLADGARGGARLWTLINTDRIDGEFRALLRSVSIALEVFPIDSVDISVETKAAVRLLSGKVSRDVTGVDLMDEIIRKSVRSIFVQFQDCKSPDPVDLRRVLNYLKITTWNDCFEEITFLEEEILAEVEESGEVGLLWSSMGFMVYSLVLFFDPPVNGKRRKDACFDLKNVENLSVDGFLCPISLDLMNDPVTISTGQTYDRVSILRWLKSGHQTCPVTGEKLAGGELIPNSALRHLISLYCQGSGRHRPLKRRDLSKSELPASSTANRALRMAANIVVGKLSTGVSEKNVAAYEMRVLSKSNLFIRLCFVEAGGIKKLLRLLSPSTDSSLQNNVIAALLNLSKHYSGRAAIFESGGLSPIIQAIKIGHKIETQQNAAAILFYLSSMECCREAIGEMPEAIPLLVEFLKNGTYRGKKNAILALYALFLFPGNQTKILAADIVSSIKNLLEAEAKGEEQEEDIVTDCVSVLAKISELPEGTEEIIKSGVLSHLIHLLWSSSSSSGREHCVSALLSICKNGGEKAVTLIEKTPLLMPSLYSLLSDGNQHASKKARSLLNYIHRLNDHYYD